MNLIFNLTNWFFVYQEEQDFFEQNFNYSFERFQSNNFQWTKKLNLISIDTIYKLLFSNVIFIDWTINNKIITDGARLFLQEFFFIYWNIYFKLNDFNLRDLNFSTYNDFKIFRRKLYNSIDEKIIILDKENYYKSKNNYLINIKYGIVDFYLNLLWISLKIDNIFNKEFHYEIKWKEVFLEQIKKTLDYFLSARWLNQDNYQFYQDFLTTKVIISANKDIKKLVLEWINEWQKFNKFLLVLNKIDCKDDDKDVKIKK